jgi:hypothetical protein
MPEHEEERDEEARSVTEAERERETEETIDEPQPWAKSSGGRDPEENAAED